MDKRKREEYENVRRDNWEKYLNRVGKVSQDINKKIRSIENAKDKKTR